MTHLLDPFATMERCIIHEQNGIGLGISATVMKELVNKVLKHGAVGSALKDAREDGAIL
jgi:hypothetical protein